MLRPIHPFPARMAPEIVWDELPDRTRRFCVLDPMAGSGTTLVAAKLRGHTVIGYDRDPLAVLIARAWLADCDPADVETKASEILKRARSLARDLLVSEAYPNAADDETKEFVRYWFDATNRIQLTALSRCISRMHDPSLSDLMWCAFSRLIITKTSGVSRAMDVSHGKPHRSYNKAPINAFDHFERAVRQVTKALPFHNAEDCLSPASVTLGDARHLPLKNSSVDVVITSPPYLNAIDYLRGHKLSLIWMKHSISEIRTIRATNVGTEVGTKRAKGDESTDRITRMMCPLDAVSSRHAGMLRQYVHDMRAVLSEIDRVLRTGGKAVLVVGNCNIRQTFVENSKCIEGIADELGMVVGQIRKRPLPDDRRYLPPPKSLHAGKALQKRMREEVILTLLKPR